ncbi:sigma-70 family RNA polymerase sigma factor [Planctomicrobium sp. SH664]|uniref:sigma-70 family RNA polymerase sigma factor n=1 Tax=Planctomicrobium sp. SH664 TaxID=3448125 RepID=UPI003F5C67E3
MTASSARPGIVNEEARRREFFCMYVAAERSICRFVQLLVHDRTLFDDVCQAVALRLWERFDTFDSTRRFEAWALGVAVNVVSELKRSDRRFARILEPRAAAMLAEAYQRDSCNSLDLGDQLSALKQCLQEMPEQYRDFIVMRYYESRSVEEVSQKTGKTIAATYKAIERSLGRLTMCVRRRLASLQGR